MMNLVDRLKYKENRNSTANNYHTIWRCFNNFLIRLDRRPSSWEDRVTLYCAFLVQQGRKSTTIKSYISAIKWVLKMDGYELNQNSMLLQSLTKACKLKNDVVTTRLPISDKLLELILFEINRIFSTQAYLCILYQTMLALGYYGLFRIGELTKSEHSILAKNVHLGTNKEKLMIVLYSSKTHGKNCIPQKIKITANAQVQFKQKRYFCPFALTDKYLKIRGVYTNDNEQFFVFTDKSPVYPRHLTNVLKTAIGNLNLDKTLYSVHSLRIGNATQMHRNNYPISRIMQAGRWKSSAVYRYLKP